MGRELLPSRESAPEGKVSYSMSYYEELEDIADPETGDFHPGIGVTSFHA